MVRLLLLLSLLSPALSLADSPTGVVWRDWDQTVFDQAQAQKKLVLLDLEAVWCHWCHVMDDKTYGDADVQRLLNQSVLTIKVDQDARPDISNRYEDYGWPATILFDSEGREIAKLSGYIRPERMIALLEAFIADPTPGPSVRPTAPVTYSSEAALSPALRRELHNKQLAHYDRAQKSWGTYHKFLRPAGVEYALSRRDDPVAQRMARETLDAGLKLIDPVWGGVYQYSDSGVWTNPHFEKIMSFNAWNMRVYSLAYAALGDARYLAAARDIERYLIRFLTSSQGAFYASQDADVRPGEHSAGYFDGDNAARLAAGIPRVDTHVYSRENGWAIQALVALYNVTGDAQTLARATAAAHWVVEHRSLGGGGFGHNQEDRGGPFLSDTLEMGRALLDLYTATANRQWLTRATAAGGFMLRRFVSKEGVGLATTTGGSPRVIQRDEQVRAVRFANLMQHVTGDLRYQSLSSTAMRYLATPEIARETPTFGPLIANAELARDPVRVTIVGIRTDPRARALHRAALRLPTAYKHVDWLEPGGARHAYDLPLPQAKQPIAIVCVAGRCSEPLVDHGDIEPTVITLQSGS